MRFRCCLNLVGNEGFEEHVLPLAGSVALKRESIVPSTLKTSSRTRSNTLCAERSTTGTQKRVLLWAKFDGSYKNARIYENISVLKSVPPRCSWSNIIYSHQNTSTPRKDVFASVGMSSKPQCLRNFRGIFEDIMGVLVLFQQGHPIRYRHKDGYWLCPKPTLVESSQISRRKMVGFWN